MKILHRVVLASFDRPRVVISACALLTLLAVFLSLGIRVDADPENMLSATQPDRLTYDKMKKDFGLHDLIVVGIVDPQGAFRPETLGPVAAAIDSILQIPGDGRGGGVAPSGGRGKSLPERGHRLRQWRRGRDLRAHRGEGSVGGGGDALRASRLAPCPGSEGAGMSAQRMTRLLAAAAIVVAMASAARAPALTLPEGDPLMERCVKAWYYAGNDAVAQVRMEIVGRGGEKRYRVMTMFRKNMGEKGEQRYLLYFHEPGDVGRMTCMVWKHVNAIDERWMFVPAANRVRRVAAPERSRFLGSDFTREEFSGRDASADAHRVGRCESLEGRPCWVVESISKKPVEYTRMTTWVDTTTFIPWKQEFRDRRDVVFRTYTTDQVNEIVSPSGRKYLTITERTLWGRDRASCTKIYFDSVRYDVGLSDADFSGAHLQVPLDAWYRGERP